MGLGDTKPNDRVTTEAGPGTEPAFYVLLEGERPLAGGLRASLANVDELVIGRGLERSFEYAESGAKLEICDERISRTHARLTRKGNAFFFEDLGSTNGIVVGGQRVSSVLVSEPTVALLGSTAVLVDPNEDVPQPGLTVTEISELKERPPGFATLVPRVEHGVERVLRVARSTLSILVLGETGVGKEVVARGIHSHSGRGGAFVAVNCGALGSLVESQLFGHQRGAFSGALRDEPGLVRAAAGGTLFLDEIGELPPSAQAALLRVLQQREVLPVGGTRAVPVDLRVVAATLRPIREDSSFRSDLYARISAYVHHVPPLRERRGDIGMLVAELLRRIAPAPDSVRLEPDLVAALATHPWPLNVRELEHVLSVALVSAGGDARLRLDHTSFEAAGTPREAAQMGTPTDAQLRAELLEALTAAEGNVSEVARRMGRTRMQIHRWMRRFGVDVRAFRNE
jgi:transcriptional regulator of acetoin/glycerol metabolism